MKTLFYTFNLFLFFSFFSYGQLTFTEDPTVPFFDASTSRAILKDLDGDGHLDVLLAGSNNSNARTTKLYKGDGNGGFTEILNTPFENVNYPDFAFGDIDGDGDIDIIMTGMDGGAGITKLYKNQGNLNFTEFVITQLPSLYYGTVDLSDIDGDGDLDLIVAGYNASSSTTETTMFINDGTGIFTASGSLGHIFDGISSGTARFIDANEDGAPDLLLSGLHYQTPPPHASITKLYLNNGSGNFTESNLTSFIGTHYNSIDFGDINNDGHLDFVLTGHDDGFNRHTVVYLGDGNGGFSATSSSASLVQTRNGDAKFGDFDGDGNLDLIITGDNQNGTYETKVYLGDGTGNFTEVPGLNIVAIAFGKIALGDVNGDGKLDILITGTDGTSYSPVTKLYLNETESSTPCAPSTPDITQLPDITSECAVDLSLLTPPTATSDCDGTIAGTLASYPLVSNDSTITWIYTNSEGNEVQQTQEIKITSIDFDVTVIDDTILSVSTQGNYTLQWIDCSDGSEIPDATNSNFVPTETGDYAVVLTSEEGCSVTSDCEEIVIETLNLQQFQDFTWNVYPNPTKGDITISSSSILDDYTVQVYSVVGEVILEVPAKGKEMVLPLGEYPNGIYFVKVGEKMMKVLKF